MIGAAEKCKDVGVLISLSLGSVVRKVGRY
jgi:hypothetical protein